MTREKQSIKYKESKNVNYLKILPNVFFILFLTMFFFIFIKFLPNFYINAENHVLYMEKNDIRYFSEYFTDQNYIIKVYLDY